MSHPYEVLTVFKDGKQEVWPFSSFDAANIRIARHKPDAVFIQVRGPKWRILEEWRASEQIQPAGTQS